MNSILNVLSQTMTLTSNRLLSPKRLSVGFRCLWRHSSLIPRDLLSCGPIVDHCRIPWSIFPLEYYRSTLLHFHLSIGSLHGSVWPKVLLIIRSQPSLKPLVIDLSHEILGDASNAVDMRIRRILPVVIKVFVCTLNR